MPSWWSPLTAILTRLEALTRSSDLGALLDKVKLAHDGFKKYSLDFTSLVAAEIKLGLNETLGLSGALRGAVHDIETKLKEIDDPRLTSWMLMMRRNEKDFMLRRDQKYVAEIKKSGAEFTKALSAVAIAPPVMAEITAKLASYQKEFAAWAETARQVAEYDANMMKTFRGFEPLMVEIAEGVERRYKEAEASRGRNTRFRENVDADCVCALRRSGVRPVAADRPLDLECACFDGVRHDQAGGRRVQDRDPGPWPQGRDR